MPLFDEALSPRNALVAGQMPRQIEVVLLGDLAPLTDAPIGDVTTNLSEPKTTKKSGSGAVQI